MPDDDELFEAAMRRLRVGAPGRPDDDEAFAEAMRNLGLAPGEEGAVGPGEPGKEPGGEARGAAARARREAEEAALFEAAVAGLDAVPGEDEAEDADAATRGAALLHGSPATLARRLRQGRIAAQAELDLHGLRRDEARRAVEAFLRRAVGEGHEVVRVVCGRGLHSRERAVLAEALDGWLDRELRPPVRERVVAPRELGGDGVRYVFLVRRPGGGRGED